MRNLIPIILSAFLVTGCPMKSSNPVSATDAGSTGGTIRTGTSVDLVSGTVGTGGGTVSVSKPGDPLDGLTLTVASNSFSTSQNFKISSAPIVSHDFGSSFKPITPLITITYNGGYSDKPMMLRIPVSLSAGQFAIGSYYDRSTGLLEALPVVDIGSDYIVISTRHFMTPSSLGKLGKGAIATPQVDLAFSKIDEDSMKAIGILPSNFTPGVDDWEFVNYGSYLAPNGHCAGQSITAMWYYITKRLRGSPSLFHAYDQFNVPDNPDSLWQDNPRGYRFASTIQVDANWDAYMANVDYSALRPDFVFNTFALALMRDKQPQLAIIRQSKAPFDGHAMIVYKVDYNAGLLYVADPNHPGNRDLGTKALTLRTIAFAGGKFQPCIASLNAKSPGEVFDQIAFGGQTAYVDWSQIQTRWTDFNNGTIGNDRFPAYTLALKDTPGVDLVDGYVSGSDTVQLICRSLVPAYEIGGTDHLQMFYVFGQYGDEKARASITAPAGIATVLLNPGANKLGFYLCGANATSFSNYVDFKWVTINCVKASITPDILNGNPNTEYTFTASVVGAGSLSLRYVWNFGDGTPDVTGTTTAKHTFTTAGTYSVSLKIYDNATGKLITTAGSMVYMLSTFVMEITGTQTVRIVLGALITTDNSYNTTFTGPAINSYYNLNNQPMVWTGMSFKGSYSYSVPPIAGTDTLAVSGSVAGTVSADGKTVTQLTASELILHHDTPENSNVSIVAINVPYISNQYTGFYEDYYYWVLGAAAQNCVSSVTIKRNLYNPSLHLYQIVSSVSVTYDSNSEIWFDFFKKM